jgi:hypothetical protein
VNQYNSYHNNDDDDDDDDSFRDSTYENKTDDQGITIEDSDDDNKKDYLNYTNL